jgi:hypothetical protein
MKKLIHHFDKLEERALGYGSYPRNDTIFSLSAKVIANSRAAPEELVPTNSDYSWKNLGGDFVSQMLSIQLPKTGNKEAWLLFQAIAEASHKLLSDSKEQDERIMTGEFMREFKNGIVQMSGSADIKIAYSYAQEKHLGSESLR